MQALVLVGGQGSRLRPLTAEIPKPVLPLAGRPFLGYMIDWLERYGVDHIVFACGFLPDQMRQVLGESSANGTRFTYLVEPEALDTAGAIRFALEHLDETFFALNGDSLADLDLGLLLQHHREHGAKATLGLYPVEDASPYGLVELTPDGEVTGFFEKPEAGRSGLISAGMYVLDREVIAALPEGRPISIEREVFPKLVGHGLHGRALDGYWKDIGTPERFLEATWDIVEGRVDTTVPVDPLGVMVDPDSHIDPAAVIGPRAVIGPGCEIGSGAVIAGSVLLGDSVVGAGAKISGSIFSSGVKVESGVGVENMVLGRDEAVHA
ncbi:MAG: NDP-sugar synthase [Solirubrobacterales bacterium]|nr:NDP-sugar synthase [Solirubrobacterales bacterium]